MATATPQNKKLLEEMLTSACHFGHKVSKWNPKMAKYIYDVRDGIHIFDLTKSAAALEKAGEFLKESAVAGKQILLVSTKLQATRLVAEAATRCQVPYVTRKWMPGLLTNFETIRKRIRYFKDLKTSRAGGDWDKYTKKEQVMMQKELNKLEEAFSGVEAMSKVPDVVVVFDAVRDALALREAKRLKIVTIAVCDSNADPDLVTYPIPGNDDAIKSLKFFVQKLSESLEDGRKLYQSSGPVTTEIAKEGGKSEVAKSAPAMVQ